MELSLGLFAVIAVGVLTVSAVVLAVMAFIQHRTDQRKTLRFSVWNMDDPITLLAVGGGQQ